ncbi:hypothetical protein Plec18167_008343 [Paecilomyces lecythidis]|uniref:Mediator of RNA polymerase II transcription subunit 20 n=1 Tax=Paecilomyces lecythidis TaxID=3004212 RepID=A0ABR3WXI9_9EURO
MAITGVFLIPSNPNAPSALPALTERLRSVFAEEPIPIGRWALEHKLMRDTPSCLPASAHAPNPVPKPKYMQFLSLTHYPTHGFIYATEATDLPHGTAAAGSSHRSTPLPGMLSAAGTPQSQAQSPTAVAGGATPSSNASQSGMVMRTVPLPSYGPLFQHFMRACEPFWCHRHTVTVPAGVVYDIGDFRIRIGDVRQTLPQARARGTVVEIEWKGSSPLTASSSSANPDEDSSDSGVDVTGETLNDAEIDAEYALGAQLIRDFWSQLGMEGAREAILVPDVGKEIKEQHRRRREGENSKRKNTRNHDDEEGWGWWDIEEDKNPDAGVDLARQYMEIFRFNR